MLRTFEPITLPTTISFFLFKIAEIVAASSGKLVPIAIIVRPIISSDTFRMRAISFACKTAYRDPSMRHNNPINKKRTIFNEPSSANGISSSVANPLDLNLYVMNIKIKKTNKRRILSKYEILRSFNEIPNTIAERANAINWTEEVLIGFAASPMHETPNISAILEIFDPITAPRASSSVLLKTEEIPTNISGADVPSATIVNPIVNSLRPNLFATNAELSTNLSAPQTKTVIEITKPNKFIKSIMYFTSLNCLYILWIFKNSITRGEAWT